MLPRSERSWKAGLYSQMFAHWVHATAGNAIWVNPFMDYETFGEHQGGLDTRYFEFPYAIFLVSFSVTLIYSATLLEVIERYSRRRSSSIFIPHFPWADLERDLSSASDCNPCYLQELNGSTD